VHPTIESYVAEGAVTACMKWTGPECRWWKKKRWADRVRSPGNPLTPGGIRDPDSTTYVGAIETAEEFGKRLYLEAWNRGWCHAEKKVVIGDGAEWIWNLAD